MAVAISGHVGAAEPVKYADFTVSEVAGTVNITDPDTNSITVALTLDPSVLKGYFQGSGSHLIVDVIGDNDIGFGALVKEGNEYFSGAWNQTVDYTMSGSDLDMGRDALWKDAGLVSAVFSANRTTGARIVFTIAYNDGRMFQTIGTAGGVKSSGWNPTGELTVDTAVVETLATYNGYISLDDAKAVGYRLAPEPATATLSLLALAGLAARRRRR